MNQEEIEDCRWHLLYKAEYSARYHRRRAAFLKNLDTTLTLVTVIAGASAFADLMAGSPGWLAKTGAASVTIIGLCQAILQLGAAGTTHAQWLKRWTRLHASISLNTVPSEPDVKEWTQERIAIEEECVAELRALTMDCENTAARVMGIPRRQRQIRPLQRLFIHFGTFQQRFPKVLDEADPEPSPTAPEHSAEPDAYHGA